LGSTRVMRYALRSKGEFVLRTVICSPRLSLAVLGCPGTRLAQGAARPVGLAGGSAGRVERGGCAC